MSWRRFSTLTGVAVVAGVILRFVYVLGTVRGRIELGGDAETYHRLGAVLAGGHGYIRPREFLQDGTVVPTAEFPPAYPLLLAALDLVGIDGPTGQRLVGALLGGITIAVVALLATAVAGRGVGVVAAWFAALYPQLVVFDGSLLSEGPYALLIAAALLAVVRARSADGRSRLRWWAAAGAALGVAVLTRGEAILLLPLLIVPATRVPGDRRAWARAAVVASAGTIVLLGAWTIRNAISLDHVQPFTNNSGTLLAGANCDAVYGGVQFGGWRLDCVRPLSVAGLDETELAAERRAAGLEYMRDHAGEVPGVMAVRVARTFGVWDVRSNLFFESLEGRDYDWLWAAWYAWIALAPLAVVGAVAQRRAGRELWPLLVPFAVVIVTSMLSYGTQRFRMIAEPSTVVLAAIGVVTLARSFSTRVATDDGPDAASSDAPSSGAPSSGAPSSARTPVADDQAQAPAGSS